MAFNFDIEELKDQVKEVISTSQGFNKDYIKIDQLMQDWLKGKREFIERLGGNLIYQSEKPISFHLEDESRRERVERFAELVSSHYNNDNLSDFLYCVSAEDFFNNKTSRPYHYGLITIPENYKIVKAFKFFIQDDPDLLKELQSEASRIIQEDVVSGYLCLSVHPLDYLSASENVHNWRSCYALDGEYRTGTLNYMADSTSVICYLKSEKDVKLPHFPKELLWNSKKWRLWLFFSNDRSMVFTGKQYPFQNSAGLKIVQDKLLPAAGFGEWTKFYQEKIDHLQDDKTGCYIRLDDKYYPVNKGLKPLKELVVDGKNTHMYNDVLRSVTYEPSYAYQKGILLWENPTGYTNDKTIIKIGHACECPLCNHRYIERSDIFACQDCIDQYDLSDIDEYYYYCDICGTSVPSDDSFELDISLMRVCSDCFHNEVVRCQICGADDMPDIITYHNGMYLCPTCQKTEHKLLNLFKNIEEDVNG